MVNADLSIDGIRDVLPRTLVEDNAFSHHYQGRIDFNTVNLFHSAGMDLACILANGVALTNPVPRGRISQYSPWRGLSMCAEY